MKKQNGFTLLEVLIALGIVAVISILSWQGLEEVLRSAGRVIQVDEQVQTTTAVFSQLEKDIAALELGLEAPTPASDLIELTGSGLLLQFTQRNTREPAYRERVEWVLDGTNLLRISRRELNPEQPSISEPIPARGLQIRFLREPGGWSSPLAFGTPTLQERSDLELQGPAVQLNTGAPPGPPPGEAGEMPQTPDTTGSREAPGGPSGPGAPGSGSDGAGVPQAQTAQSLIRAVEVSLTQGNNQAVTRVFRTGGVY
jgi:general secretion pathway protein J